MIRPADRRWPNNLARLDLFADASPRQLRDVARLLTCLTLDAGEILIREGTIGLEFLIIAEGEARVEAGGRTLATLGRGDFIGEMALLENVPRSATVTAATPITFFVCNSAEFATLLDVAPSVGAKIIAAAHARQEANRLAA